MYLYKVSYYVPLLMLLNIVQAVATYLCRIQAEYEVRNNGHARPAIITLCFPNLPTKGHIIGMPKPSGALPITEARITFVRNRHSFLYPASFYCCWIAVKQYSSVLIFSIISLSIQVLRKLDAPLGVIANKSANSV